MIAVQAPLIQHGSFYFYFLFSFVFFLVFLVWFFSLFLCCIDSSKYIYIYSIYGLYNTLYTTTTTTVAASVFMCLFVSVFLFLFKETVLSLLYVYRRLCLQCLARCYVVVFALCVMAISRWVAYIPPKCGRKTLRSSSVCDVFISNLLDARLLYNEERGI